MTRKSIQPGKNLRASLLILLISVLLISLTFVLIKQLRRGNYTAENTPQVQISTAARTITKINPGPGLTSTEAPGQTAASNSPTPTSNQEVQASPTEILPPSTQTPEPTATTIPTVAPPTNTQTPSSIPVIPTPTQMQIPPPSGLDAVHRNETFSINTTGKVVYARALTHKNWNGDNPEVIKLTLDIYTPNTGSGALRPAIILYHGGGFQTGSSVHPELISLAKYFAPRGWVVISVNYRLEEDHGSVPDSWTSLGFPPSAYPAGRDAKAAVRWVHAHAADYQISSNHISVLGSSAGALLSVMLGASNPGDFRDELTLEQDPTLQTTNLTSRSDVRTVISLWGDGQLLQALSQIDGQNRFDSGDSPLLIVHGTKDTTIPFSSAEELYNTYLFYGIPVVFYPLGGVGHYAWGSTLSDGRTINEAIFDFMVSQQGLLVED